MFTFKHTVEGQYEQIIKYFNTPVLSSHIKHCRLHAFTCNIIIQSIITCILLHNTNYKLFKRFGDKPGQVGV